MKRIYVYLLIFIITLGGCNYIDKNPKLATSIAESVFKIGVRIAISSVLHKNPDLAPYFISASTVFADTKDPKPEIIENSLKDLIYNLDIGIVSKAVIMGTINDIMTQYDKIYNKEKDNIDNNVYLSILGRIADVMYVTSNSFDSGTVASNSGYIIKASNKVLVIVE